MSQTIQIAYDSRSAEKEIESGCLLDVVKDDVLDRCQLVPVDGVKKALGSLASGDVDMAIVANDCYGQITLARCPDPNLRIAGEIAVPVQHALFAPKGATMDDVSYVYIPYDDTERYNAVQCNNALFGLVNPETTVHFCRHFVAAYNRLHEAKEKDGKAIVVPEYAQWLMAGKEKLADLKVDIAKLYYLVGHEETAKHVHLPYDEKTGRFDGSPCVTVFTVENQGSCAFDATCQPLYRFNERRGHWESSQIQEVLDSLECTYRPRVLGSFKASAYRLRAGL